MFVGRARPSAAALTAKAGKKKKLFIFVIYYTRNV